MDPCWPGWTGGMEGGGSEGHHQREEVLSHVVDTSIYTPMTQPGALQPAHFLPPFSSELVLVTLPDVVNPMNLINSELVIGGRKDSQLVAGKHKYRVTTYPASQDTTCLPSLFLPDQDGKLTKVTSDIKAFLVVKGEVEEEEEDGKNRVDIEALRSIPCKLPKNLQRRDFLGKSRRVEALAENIKPTKRKKKGVGSLPSPDDSGQPSGKDRTSRKKKRGEALSPHIKTSGSPTDKKHKVLPNAEELGSHIKRTIKKEKL